MKIVKLFSNNSHKARNLTNQGWGRSKSWLLGWIKHRQLPFFFVLPAILFFIYFLYSSLLASNYQQVQGDIDKYISQWKYEISESLFYNKNGELVQKLVDGLRVFPIFSYEVIVGELSVYQWSQSQEFLQESPTELTPLTIQNGVVGVVGVVANTIGVTDVDNRAVNNTMKTPSIIVNDAATTITEPMADVIPKAMGFAGNFFSEKAGQINRFGYTTPSTRVSTDATSTDCNKPFESPLTLNGLHLGKIRFCLSETNIAQMTLFSPLFISLILVVMVLIIGAALFPLLGYKKALTSTLGMLKKWNLHPENNLYIGTADEVTNEVVRLVKQGVDVRMDLKAVQLELDTEKEISKITKQVAHDILSPVTALNMAMQGNFRIPKAQSDLIALSIQRIVETSRDLLNQGGKNSYRSGRLCPVQVAPLIHDIFREKEVLNENIKFTFNVVPENIEVICSPVEFKRSLSNIINNSIEATSNGSGVISCQAFIENNLCKIVITDNGKGIIKENLDRVFDENFTSGKESGTGLGLYYVQKKVREWGGFVQIESAHRGTMVQLSLRVSSCADDGADGKDCDRANQILSEKPMETFMEQQKSIEEFIEEFKKESNENREVKSV